LNKKHKIFLIIITLFIIFSLTAPDAYTNEPDEVYLISIKGTIDLGLSSYVQRALEEAVLNKAKAVILEIDTFGGRVDAATQIRDKIMSLNIPSVAYVKNRAWSAGALIALSAEYILIDKSASIGAAEPRPADEKNISALRAEFTSTALSRGRSEEIAAAMVDKDIEIKDIIEKDKILTLNAEQAIRLNFVDDKASSIEEVLNFLNLKDAKTVNIVPNWAENISRFVTNPVVSPLLLSIGFLGLIIEFWTLGWGIAGSIGIISLSLFFVIGFFLLIKYIPSTRTWRKFVLSTEQKKELGYTVGTKDLKRLTGKEGIAITPLRPSGIVEVNGKKLNSLTRGEYVDSNTKIKIISVEGNKIVVEAVNASK
jgi:membrane-bound serine protease (ClpP class)